MTDRQPVLADDRRPRHTAKRKEGSGGGGNKASPRKETDDFVPIAGKGRRTTMKEGVTACLVSTAVRLGQRHCRIAMSGGRAEAKGDVMGAKRKDGFLGASGRREVTAR